MIKKVGQTKGRKIGWNVYRRCHQKELPNKFILSTDRKE
jgi:hypothetical protein